MANGAQNAVATLMNPGTWKKVLDSPEESLVSLMDYLERFEEWLTVTGMHGMLAHEKWALLSATGGQNMRDLLKHESGIEWRYRAHVPARQYAAAVPGQPAAQPPVAPIPEVLQQDEITAIVTDTWEVGVQKMREAIIVDTNPVMSRYHLFQEMPQADWDIQKWAIELERQAKRIDWASYNWKEACKDAILFQMTSDTWRDKSMKEQWTFQQIVNWGKKNKISAKHGKRLDHSSKSNKGRDDDEDHTVDRVQDDRRGG